MRYVLWVASAVLVTMGTLQAARDHAPPIDCPQHRVCFDQYGDELKH